MQRYMKRDERKRELLLTALGRRQWGKKTFTTYSIAKAIGMKPSTHLRQILAELVATGELVAHRQKHRNNVVKFVYALSPETIQRGLLL